MLYTPGHTDDSYSYLMGDRVFTGDTLLIRGTGRTDFQNGDPRAQYDSIFNKLLKLPEDTLVFPAHDYKGETVSTIGEERAFNPRLQVQVGRRIRRADEQPEAAQSEDDGRGGARQHEGRARAGRDRAARLGGERRATRMALVGRPDVAFIDLREKGEQEKHGVIPGSLHAPYPDLRANIAPGGMLRALVGEPAAAVLLRLRRALRHGGAGRAGCAAHLGLPPAGRHRCLEEGAADRSMR